MTDDLRWPQYAPVPTLDADNPLPERTPASSVPDWHPDHPDRQAARAARDARHRAARHRSAYVPPTAVPPSAEAELWRDWVARIHAEVTAAEAERVAMADRRAVLAAVADLHRPTRKGRCLACAKDVPRDGCATYALVAPALAGWAP